MKKLPLLLLMLAFTICAAAQTSQIAAHASHTLSYQYTADVSGVTLWIDNNGAPNGFIQYDGLTCTPISTWELNQTYPLPSSTNRTQPAFSLHVVCTTKTLPTFTFDVIETGFAYWGGYGRTAGVYYFVQNGTITQR